MAAIQGFGLIYIDSSQRRLQTFFSLSGRRRECCQSGRGHLRIRDIVAVARNPVNSLILYSHIEFLLQQTGCRILIQACPERHARLQTC